MPIPFHERKSSTSAKQRTAQNMKKYDKELKNILRRVKYENINQTVEEVLTNFVLKEDTKLQMTNNKESIIHNELLKNNYIGVDEKMKINRKNSANIKNKSESSNDINPNDKKISFLEKNKTIFNVHKNLNYIYSKYNKNKFFNIVYNPPPVLKKKKLDSDNKSVRNSKDSNRSRKNLNKNKRCDSSEGCKFRLFNKKYSSSVDGKNELINSEKTIPVNKPEIQIKKSPNNSNKIVNPLIRSVPLTLQKSEESFFKNHNPEYLKIKSNYSSTNYFSKERQISVKADTKNSKIPIYNRLYDDHFRLKMKQERLVMDMRPSFSPTLYKPLKKITFENFFI